MREEYNVGDVVVVKRLKLGEDYPFGLTKDMCALSNVVTTITKKTRHSDGLFSYHIAADRLGYNWHKSMFWDQDISPC